MLSNSPHHVTVILHCESKKKRCHFFTAYNFRNIEQIFTKFGTNHSLFILNVQNEETLICAKFGEDLFNISKVIRRKKVAQFFDSVYMYAHGIQKNAHIQTNQTYKWQTINLSRVSNVVDWTSELLKWYNYQRAVLAILPFLPDKIIAEMWPNGIQGITNCNKITRKTSTSNWHKIPTIRAINVLQLSSLSIK